jgi:hypothetical protein
MRFEGILEWFSGKSRDTIVNFTIPALVECEQIGYWKKGVSRTVHATLNKQNVAAKWAKACTKKFGVNSYGSVRMPHDHPLTAAEFALSYGQVERAPQILKDLLAAKKLPEDVKAMAEDAIRWARAFSEVADLVALLDARRPKPNVVMKTLSPTVAKNVSTHIGLDVSTIQSPPMHGEWVEMIVKGVKQQVWQIVIDWPEGTKHCASRFAFGSKAGNQQCEACGHAIKDPWNWLPILAYDATKTPYSLWVGRDCAKKLFGCEIEGDAIYKREGDA